MILIMQPKIYFACSIRGGREDAELYAELCHHIKSQAYLLTEIFSDHKLTPQGSPGRETDIWQQDMDWFKESNAVIAEVTTPSLGVGYEIAKAEEWGKPVLALYRQSDGKKLSAMIAGTPHSTVVYYTAAEEAKSAISEFISQLHLD